MKEDYTIKEITEKTEKASTDFEQVNSELKRKYLIWNIEAFNMVASKVSVNRGAFGTGYPFYALNQDLKGTIPIIQEQIRYNRILVRDGIRIQKSIWKCESCLTRKYSQMPDLKTVCKPCPNMIDELKPRKIMNRLPDLDMWIVCEDGCVSQAEAEMSKLLEKNKMYTSDKNPLSTLEEVAKISEKLKQGERPDIYLPIDAHIIEYSKLKDLIIQVPEELSQAKKEERIPYLPIHPKSYRKQWQYDDEAYNFIYDFLSAFTAFNFTEELQKNLDEARGEISTEYAEEELFAFLLNSATEANFRRFQSIELEEIFKKKISEWKSIRTKKEYDEISL